MTHSASEFVSSSPNGPSDGSPSADRSPWTWPILIALMALNVLGSLYWIRTNIVMVGHDATSYLETSIKYTRFFTGLSLANWFQAITFPDYRTPAIYIATQPFLHLFGVDMDGAQMLNVALLPLVILATYFLGKRIAGSTVGTVAAALVGFLPLMAAMSRLYYVEILLTVVVVFNLLALLRTDRFTNRTWSLIWGISLGIGMLVKWTLPMYLLFPTLLVVWQSRLLHEQIAWLRRPRLSLKALGPGHRDRPGRRPDLVLAQPDGGPRIPAGQRIAGRLGAAGDLERLRDHHSFVQTEQLVGRHIPGCDHRQPLVLPLYRLPGQAAGDRQGARSGGRGRIEPAQLHALFRLLLS